MGEDAIRDAGRDERMTVADAAERLDITKEAVRKRISRGTLRSDKDSDGTVHVYVPSSGTASGTASEPIGRDELVELLRAQLEDLRADRDAWREQARRSDYMANAAMERTRELESRIRALEAPQGERESSVSPGVADTPTEEDSTEVQATIELPQQRSGWLAPVDKLPWWQYVLGIIAVFLATCLTFAAALTARGGQPSLLFYAIVFAGPWAAPGVFGFWVGFRQRITRFWSQIIPFGALVGAVAALGFIAYAVGVQHRSEQAVQAMFPEILALLGGLYVLPAWLLYASGLLIGNAWQRRRTGRISGITPASPIARSTQASAQPREDWSPRKQALLGWSGTIISALLTLVGTIIAVGSGP